MMVHMLRAHPELAGQIGKTGYKRVIKTFLKAEFKTFLGYAADHNVSLKSIALNLAYNSASVLYKQGKHRYEQLNRQLLSGTLGSVTAADVQAAKDIMGERQEALLAAQKALDADAFPDIELRTFLAMLFEVVSKLEELSVAADNELSSAQCRILATEVDDKSATELHWLRWRTAGGEPLYYIGENGQMQPATQRGNFYLMPPYANSKDSTTICCELFLDCVRELKAGHRIKVTCFDCGPLNRAQLVSLHWTQFLVDSGLVDVAMTIFFVQYKGKCIVDGRFGAHMAVLRMLSAVVGIDDFARMIEGLPTKEQAWANGSTKGNSPRRGDDQLHDRSTGTHHRHDPRGQARHRRAGGLYSACMGRRALLGRGQSIQRQPHRHHEAGLHARAAGGSSSAARGA